MFSGIKYIFGYTGETATQSVNDDTGLNGPQINNDAEASSSLSSPKAVAVASIETSTTKLEQTLNAATTKFTEQLLPQQASIEQLQSSSRQLLPSIIEQHKEDELKKNISSCDKPDGLDGEDDDDDDQDGFNAESWELLDLVEKVENEVALVGLTLPVQREGETLSQGLCKSTSGILKSQNNCDTSDNSHTQKRQKPKVSFEAPDLVKFKQEIEQTNSNVTIGASGSGKANVGEQCKKLVEVVECKKVPILNYAKALTTKLENNVKQAKLSENIIESIPCSSKATINDAAPGSNGPVKRVRPTRVSTSSWSSQDDDDDIEQVDNVDWELSYEKPIEISPVSAQVVDREDNESVISSGFSDCDYGFGGINDYVMRPKKSNAKRGRTVSGSSIGRMKSKPERKLVNAKVKSLSTIEGKADGKSEVKDNKSDAPSSSPRNSKPKKKRMIMSTNKVINLSDFMKNRPGGNKEVGQQRKKFESFNRQVAQKQIISGGSTESSDIAEMDESWFVTPPPCFTGAVKTNETSRVEVPKTKEADRENALIEHPSVYIANATLKSTVNENVVSTAESQLAGSSKVKAALLELKPKASKSLNALEDESWNSGDDEHDVMVDDGQLLPISKVVNITEKSSSLSCDKDVFNVAVASEATLSNEMSVLIVADDSEGRFVSKKASKPSEKRKAQTNSKAVVLKPSETKAWKNKFIVDVWDLDDNDDVDDDFDNMFEVTKTRKSSNKKKKQQQKQMKARKLTEDNMSLGSNEIASSENDVSGSVELLSVKSLVPLEFENNENFERPTIGLDVNKQQVFDELKQVTTSPMSKIHVENRRPPTQVRPIEPERVPSWQLKRQRFKRRPLVAASLAVNSKQQTATTNATKTFKVNDDLSSASAGSSSRSTPTLIDRIGCSIVANLTNLTSGLVSSGAMNYCQSNGQSSIIEGQEKTISNKSNMNRSAIQVARKQLSRGSIRRQNICAKQANTLRRPDRRLKLFTTPNGCSINRKVHTSIH